MLKGINHYPLKNQQQNLDSMFSWTKQDSVVDTLRDGGYKGRFRYKKNMGG